ncbi:MAG: SMI1/KNR4 family protein [Tumebacillaceae bacterium]
MEPTGIELFDRLVRSLQNDELIVHDEEGSHTVRFSLNPPAQVGDIEKGESKLGVSLPKSYREFLLRYNGGRIYDYKGLGGFELMGTEEIELETNSMKAVYEEDWLDSLLVFATCIGEGDFLSFSCDVSNTEYQVLDCYHDDKPSNWLVISNSFDEWIKRVVLHNGEKFWLTDTSSL